MLNLRPRSHLLMTLFTLTWEDLSDRRHWQSPQDCKHNFNLFCVFQAMAKSCRNKHNINE